MMIIVLIAINGTAHPSVSFCMFQILFDSLRISVRTLAIRCIVFALTLVVSCTPPKPGSVLVLPHPTILLSVYSSVVDR